MGVRLKHSNTRPFASVAFSHGLHLKLHCPPKHEYQFLATKVSTQLGHTSNSSCLVLPETKRYSFPEFNPLVNPSRWPQGLVEQVEDISEIARFSAGNISSCSRFARQRSRSRLRAFIGKAHNLLLGANLPPAGGLGRASGRRLWD